MNTQKTLTLFALSATLLLMLSCKKEVIETTECETNAPNKTEACDIIKYTGDWNFTVNGDNNTTYSGKIYQFNDSVLNVHYQPEDLMTAGDNYFKQLTVTNCDNGTFPTVTIPHGNTGGWTKKEGTITATSFEYIETSRYVDYVTGEESFGEKRIIGTKVE